jgi:hypothetical protein
MIFIAKSLPSIIFSLFSTDMLLINIASLYIYLYPGKAQWYTDNSSGSLKKQEEICFIAFCVV